jgi:hypothetical protein
MTGVAALDDATEQCHPLGQQEWTVHKAAGQIRQSSTAKMNLLLQEPNNGI